MFRLYVHCNQNIWPNIWSSEHGTFIHWSCKYPNPSRAAFVIFLSFEGCLCHCFIILIHRSKCVFIQEIYILLLTFLCAKKSTSLSFKLIHWKSPSALLHRTTGRNTGVTSGKEAENSVTADSNKTGAIHYQTLLWFDSCPPCTNLWKLVSSVLRIPHFSRRWLQLRIRHAC